jgi:uncharacterized protein YbjT (DUF2867 family)
MAVDDVALGMARVAVDEPSGHTVEIAGPEQFRLDELVRRVLRADQDDRAVITDPTAPYFGAVLSERSLLPGPTATIFMTRFESWLTKPNEA